MRVYLAAPLFTPYERRFIEECAEALRDEEFEVFVPHEQALASVPEATGASIFAKDWPGIEAADALLAILDGATVDDGVACEIGIFLGLQRADPRRKGVVGLLTDMRAVRHDVNPFVRGAIESTGGAVVGTLDEAVDLLSRWRRA